MTDTNSHSPRPNRRYLLGALSFVLLAAASGIGVAAGRNMPDANSCAAIGKTKTVAGVNYRCAARGKTLVIDRFGLDLSIS